MPDLLTLPTVTPDYRTHTREDFTPRTEDAPKEYEAVAAWLAREHADAWAGENDLYRWCVANALLARRQMFDAGELTS